MFRLAFETYRAARKLGLSLDIVAPDADLSGYSLVLAPGLLETPKSLETFHGTALIGPRTGSKTSELSIPTPMGPNITGLDCTSVRVQSLPPTCNIPLENGGCFKHWLEDLEGNAEIALRTKAGAPAIMRAGTLHYMAGWPEADTYVDILETLAHQAGLKTQRLPDGLRIRDTPTHRFWFNYAPDDIEFEGRTIKSADIQIETH